MIAVEFLDEDRTVARIRQSSPWRWLLRFPAVVDVVSLYGGTLWVYDSSNRPVTDSRVLAAIDRARAT